MDRWDALAATCFQHLGDGASYVRADTGTTHAVRIVPLDEAESWNAKGLTVAGNNIIARVYAYDIEGWAGPMEGDKLTWRGGTYDVHPKRNELNGVYVTHITKARR